MTTLHLTILASLLLFLGAVIIGNVILNINAQSDDKKQFFIKDQIIKLEATGQYKLDPEYQQYYTPWKLVDNLTNTVSYWSENGHSTVIFKTNPLDKPLCSIEVGVKEPELLNRYAVKVSNSSAFKQASGILDQANTVIDIQGCVNNVNSIEFTFDPANPKEWTILSEVRFFSNKDMTIPPIEPPICNPDEHIENNVCVPNTPSNNNNTATITNSTVTLNVSNSTVKIYADQSSNISAIEPSEPMPALQPTQFTDPSIKITDMQPTKEITHDPNDKSDEKEEQEEREEQEKDNNNNDKDEGDN